MNIGFGFSPSITFLAMAVALLHLAVPAEAQTAVTNTLNPVADSYVRDGVSSNSNYGTITSLYARTNSTIINNGYVLASYLKFNLSSVSNVTSAKLRIYAKLNASQGPIAVAAYSATDTNWTETGITWSNRPALGTQLGSVEVINNTEQWYEYDVTSFIKDEKAAGRTFVSLALYATSVSINNTSNWAIVRSREAASNIPELVCVFDPSLGDWGPVMTWGYPDAEGSGRNVAVHLVVLPTGKLIMYPYDTPPRLWDPGTSELTTLLWPTNSGDRHNIFCGAHSHIPDGRVLFTGGDIADTGVSRSGEEEASYFNPGNNTWTALSNMNAGRWYGTSTALANGDVLVTSGFMGSGDINRLPQVWMPAGAGMWHDLNSASATNVVPPLYTRTFLAPNGKVFFAMGFTTNLTFEEGGDKNIGTNRYSRYLDTSGTGTWSDPDTNFIPKLPGHNNPFNPVAAACMDEAGTVYWFGGCYDGDDRIGQPTNACEKINLALTNAQWTLFAPMTNAQGVPQPRKYHTATILPDGMFLITSGSDNNLNAAQNVIQATNGGRHALLYDPMADTWTTLAKEGKFRGYHSTAVLLPDGRVLSASGYGEWLDPSAPADANAEIFSPPYLFKGTRPVISSAPSEVAYGETFSVGTPDATNIAKVTWTRLGNTTHGFNWDQRINTLTNFSKNLCGGLNITAPANPTNCPPGYYMLWLINSNGVPSISSMVRISADSFTPYRVTLTATDAYAAEPEFGSDNGTFTVTRYGGNNSSALTVYYAVSGTATPTNDYAALSNSVTIPANQSSASISVNVVDDSAYEWNETVIITLSTDQAYVIGGCSSAEVTIHSFLDLGVLPGGTESRAFSINPSGRIAGRSEVNGYSRAFRSVADQALTGDDDLHPGLAQFLGLPATNSSSVAFDQTTNRFAGEFTYTNATRAWVWGPCTNYQQLVAPNSSQNFIRAVADWEGNTEGAGFSLIYGTNRFLHWFIDDCQPQYTYAYNIGASVWPGYHSYGLGIKWSRVVGVVAYPAGNQGFIWDWNYSGNGPTYLNPPTGGGQTEAYDIDKYSSNTNIVGYAETNGLKTACYWTYNGYTSSGISPTLLTKPAGWSNSIAQALNDQNKIVGHYYQPSNPAETDRRACLWESGSLVELNNIVPVGSSWVLLTAEDINSTNHVVGTAWNGTQIRGFRLKP